MFIYSKMKIYITQAFKNYTFILKMQNDFDIDIVFVNIQSLICRIYLTNKADTDWIDFVII